MRNSLRVAVLVVAAAAPRTLAAQRATVAPESIPRVLVDALLRPFTDGAPVPFTVGRVPEKWPAALVPAAPARVVGGSGWGFSRFIVVSYPRSVHAEDVYGASLRRAGYHAVDSTQLAAEQEGFVGPSPDQPFAGGRLWCRDSANAVVMSPIDSTATARRMLVLLATGPGVSAPPCMGTGRSHRRDQFASNALRLPPLRAPAGVRVQSIGSSGGGSSFNVHATADTTLSAGALVTHYGAELARGGWTLAGRAADGGRVATQPVMARDSTGTEWNGVLSVVTVGDKRLVHLMMARPSDY